MMTIRNYNPSDYTQVTDMYKQSDLYGGQFDEARDSKGHLNILTEGKPGSILVAESGSKIVGTVTCFEDGRSAWVYRFAVKKGKLEHEATKQLWDIAKGFF